MENKKAVIMTEFDRVTLDESLQMLKVLIPYLDFSLQKSIALVIRIKELENTINYYNNPHNVFTDKAKLSGADIMQDLSQYCPEDIQNTIQTFSAMMQANSMMNMMNSMNSVKNTGPEMALMNDTQMKQFNEYMEMLDFDMDMENGEEPQYDNE